MTDMRENLMAPAGKPILSRGHFGLLSASFDERKLRLVDLLSGYITDIPYERTGDSVRIPDLPVTDYPMAVVFGDFI